MNESEKEKIIHVAKIHPPKHSPCLLFLKQVGEGHFVWYQETGANEEKTQVAAPTIEDAMRIAHKKWGKEGFRTVICGFRYTLPERDEHGMNALFHQMAASYNSPNGIYFDSELGHNCFVQNASNEALSILERLKSQQ